MMVVHKSPESLAGEALVNGIPLVSALRASARVVVVQPWMVRDLGLAAVWFAQLLWHLEVTDSYSMVRADHEWVEETGLSRTQVQRCRAKLADLGWIDCQVRKVAGAPTTHITVNADAVEAHLRAMHCSIPSRPGSLGIEQTSTSQRSVDDVKTPATEQSFDDFWQSYPRRVGKGQALKAWKQALKIATVEEIMVGVERYAKEREGGDPKFVAHPSTWLNGHRWLDDPGANTVGNGNGARRKQQVIDTDRDGPSGEIDVWEGIR